MAMRRAFGSVRGGDESDGARRPTRAFVTRVEDGAHVYERIFLLPKSVYTCIVSTRRVYGSYAAPEAAATNNLCSSLTPSSLTSHVNSSPALTLKSSFRFAHIFESAHASA